jgi:endo-1,3(4)-beta-glucanase
MRSSATLTGTQFTVVNDAGTYVIYALTPITFTIAPLRWNFGVLQASSAFTGILRVAMLNDDAHKPLLDAHASTYATNVGLDYQFTSTTATLVFYWTVVGNAADLLLLTFPHHRLTIQSPNFPPTSNLSYLTTKVCFVNLLLSGS